MGCVVMVAEVQTDAEKRLIALVRFDTQNPKATSSKSTPRWEEPKGSLTTGSMPQRIELLTISQMVTGYAFSTEFSSLANELFSIPQRHGASRHIRRLDCGSTADGGVITQHNMPAQSSHVLCYLPNRP
jgi:hypothetical protein